MAKEFSAEIKEWIAPVKENNNSNWCKYIIRASYNNKPANIDIRNIKFDSSGQHLFGKGISLTDEECDTVVDILLGIGYGTTESLKKAVKKRESVYINTFDDDEYKDNKVKVQFRKNGKLK